MFSGCRANTKCVRTPVPLASLSVKWDGPVVGKKAMAFPSLKTIYLDTKWFYGLPYVDGRLAIFCHEWGHVEGARCEECADWCAGMLMRELGYPTSRDARRTLLAALDHRDAEAAQENLDKGFQAQQLDSPHGVDRDWLMGKQTKDVTGYENNQPVALVVYEVEKGKWLEREAARAYLQAKDEAGKQGITFGLESGFRTMEEQQRLFAQYGSPRAAQPGYSPHQRGLGGDINSRTSEERERAMAYLVAHGWERLPSEPWHVTYRGSTVKASESNTSSNQSQIGLGAPIMVAVLLALMLRK